MQESIEGFFERVVDLARENPLVFAGVSAVVLIVSIFWNATLLVLRGLLYTGIALAVLFGVIMLWAKVKYRKPSLRALFSEKKRLLDTVKIAEQRYMKRKLSEKDFNRIFKEKQRRLIEVEAFIDQQYNQENKEKIGKEILAVQTKKRHILKSLLDEKRRLIREMDIAEKRYLKRMIDAKTYQDLVQLNQQRLVELEANIRALYDEANVSRVMSCLRQKLSELEAKKKTKKRKKAKDEREQGLQIAKEIAEQISRK